MADKDLAKVLTTEEKEKDKEKTKKSDRRSPEPKKKGFYRPRFHPYQNWGSQGYPQGYQAPMGQHYQAGGPPYPRQDTRLCLNCRQPGHLFRFCPQRNQQSSAFGVPQK